MTRDAATPDEFAMLDGVDVLAFGDDLARALALASSYVIGRAGDVVVGDARVSRRHLRIDRADDTTTCRDLGSANGSWIVRGGERLPVGADPVVLHEADRVVTIADVELYRHQEVR